MNPIPTPPVGEAMTALEQLMARLRAPGGCPWDREQTPLSLLPYTIEETYEVVDAVERGDVAGLREELGDLLFHVVFYSQIAREEGAFTLAEVIHRVTVKMTQRHPHVFGTMNLNSADAVVENWEAIKKDEKAGRGSGEGDDHSVFHGLSPKMPALLWSYKVQQKMHKVGFDWDTPEAVAEKVREELDELAGAHAAKEADAIEEEVGDVLFTMVNLARQLKVNPETALRRATFKFQERFRYMERQLHAAGEKVENTPLERLEELWQEGKRQERAR